MAEKSSFDLNTQTGVMHVLASIRASTASPAAKNELRDLVFQYSNGGHDPTIRIALEQKLATHNITAAAKPAAPGRVLPFGSARPAPRFKAPPVPVTPTSPQTDVQTKTAKTQSVAQTTPPPQTAPVVHIPKPTEPAPTPTPKAVVPDPVVIETPPPQPVSAPTPVVAAPNPLDRIREIKIAVNKRVGNPVHLVDINNEVGREYMAALLEAMKQLSGGVAGGIESAMVRLEAAYSAVETVVSAHEKNSAGSSAAPQPLPQPAASTPPVIPTIPAVPNVPPVVHVPVQPQVPVTPIVVAPNTPPVRKPTQDHTPPTATPFTQPVAAVPAQAPAPSIATEKAPLTPQDLKTTLHTGDAASDPLLTPEIDAGLDQLLNDWSLFKKSGLFGTGPKGREHPLFKKLAPLQIPLLLTGRFEGATQEVKQSITDYMNGWRFEQGIIYEQTETFEHYLRRVIKKILDLQKRRTPA